MVWNKLRHTAQLIVCAALAACAAAPAPVARACAAGARQGGARQGGVQSEEVPLLIMESLRARRQSVPAVLLYQLPELLNGCEATSLAMLLKSYGIAADKMELAYQYLPRAEFYEEDGVVYGPAPDDAYAGDPAAQGYYCYAQPVCTAANLYLQQAGQTLRAQDLTGTTPAGLELLLCEGCPVVVWGTLQFETPQFSATHSWFLEETGEEYIPYSNLHCMLLYGYDEDFYYLCDPLYGYQAVEKAQFASVYEQMECRAVALDAPAAVPARMTK